MFAFNHVAMFYLVQGFKLHDLTMFRWYQELAQ